MRAKKRPVEIEFFPCSIIHIDDIMKWSTPERPITQGRTHDHKFVLDIETLEGTHQATEKDMIIKGIKGEVYPCKKDIFYETYTSITRQ